MVADDHLREAWEESYRLKQNTLFYPSENVIAFVNKHIRRRVGPQTYSREFARPPTVLEIGSGSGRHIKYLVESGFYPIGIEPSAVASDQAVSFLAFSGIDPSSYRLLTRTADAIPLPDGTADYAVSAATLDSMPKAAAVTAAAEVRRLLKEGGLFYVDLMSTLQAREGVQVGPTEYLVQERHERGTVQLHYDDALIEEVFQGFSVRDIRLDQTLDRAGGVIKARWVCILER